MRGLRIIGFIICISFISTICYIAHAIELKGNQAPATQQQMQPGGITQKIIKPGDVIKLNPQPEPPLPNIVSSSEQTIQKLRSAEEAKRNMQIQNLSNTISAKFKALSPSCTGTTITSVFPTEAYPGDPVLIQGCGFTNNEGMVLMSGFSEKLEIESWANHAIKAKIPKVKGFVDPKSVSFKVVTTSSTISSPSVNITLKPNMEFASISSPLLMRIDSSRCPSEARGGC